MSYRENNYNFLYLIVFIVLLLVASVSRGEDDVYALERLVVVGSRIPVPEEHLGSAVTVIERKEIEARQLPFVSDLLRSVPGIAVSRTGTVGNLTSVRIRGAEANHTLVLIDGVEANDPISDSAFNFAHLLSADVERIEILRGPQSALWGSDSIGGVVNIITRESRGGLSGDLGGEAGSFDTTQFRGHVGAQTEAVDYVLSAASFANEGINVARMGDEKEAYENLTLSGKFGVEVSDHFRLDTSLRFVDADTESDNQDFAFPATPSQGLAIDTDTRRQVRQLYGHARGELALLDGKWLQSFRVAFSDNEAENSEDGLLGSDSEAERTKFVYQSSYFFAPYSALTLALEHEDLSYENMGATPDALQNQRQDDTQRSLVAEYRGQLAERFYYSLGLRQDNNDLFDDAATYRVTGAYLFREAGTRLHASLASGVTNPGFFELYGFFPGSFVGNPELEPEKSRGFDVGVQQSFWGGRGEVDLTYFDFDLQDEIVTIFDLSTFLSSVDNLDDDSRRKGVELGFSTQVAEWFSLSSAYTYTDARDPGGLSELRRPEHVASLNATFTMSQGRGLLDVGLDYNGEQQDAEFIFATPETSVTLDSYLLLNVAGSYRVSDQIRVHARLENVLDEDYEEVFSFRTPGFGAFAGISWEFGS